MEVEEEMKCERFIDELDELALGTGAASPPLLFHTRQCGRCHQALDAARLLANAAVEMPPPETLDVWALHLEGERRAAEERARRKAAGNVVPIRRMKLIAGWAATVSAGLLGVRERLGASFRLTAIMTIAASVMGLIIGRWRKAALLESGAEVIALDQPREEPAPGPVVSSHP